MNRIESTQFGTISSYIFSKKSLKMKISELNEHNLVKDRQMACLSDAKPQVKYQWSDYKGLS